MDYRHVKLEHSLSNIDKYCARVLLWRYNCKTYGETGKSEAPGFWLEQLSG